MGPTLKKYKKNVPPVTVPFTPFSTPEDLAAFCLKLKGKRRPALELGASLGITATSIDVLRYLLDYSGSQKKGLPKEIKQEIIEKARAGAFAVDIAKEYKIDFQYVYQFLKRRNLLNCKNDFWTERKIRQLCLLMFNGKTARENAEIMGISRDRFLCMKGRLLRRQDCARWLPIAEKMGIYNHA